MTTTIHIHFVLIHVKNKIEGGSKCGTEKNNGDDNNTVQMTMPIFLYGLSQVLEKTDSDAADTKQIDEIRCVDLSIEHIERENYKFFAHLSKSH